MDCFFRLDVCKASRINSYKKAARMNDTGDLVFAKVNCRIVVDTHNRIISMEATKHIPKNDELFCDYGDMYVL